MRSLLLIYIVFNGDPPPEDPSSLIGLYLCPVSEGAYARIGVLTCLQSLRP